MWFGIAVTAFFVWLVLRDVSFAEVGRARARANWLLLFGLSVPAYLAAIVLRAVRWRHLTDPIQPIGPAALSRAVAVGFMANNVFPLRMGEVMRAWYLSRETGASAAALFGTVVLERVVDTVMVICLALVSLSLLGRSTGNVMAQGALALLPAALLPLVVLIALRRAPERVIAWTRTLLRPFPERVSVFADQQLRRFAEGLGALSGGSHLFWIGIHSLVLWGVLAPLPFVAGFLALDIDFATAGEMAVAALVTLAAIGVAVALPSAPGFFGTYHQACKLALSQFGIDRDTAVDLGTLFHVVFWLTTTGAGLAVLRLRRTSLQEMEQAAGPPEASEPPDPRASP